jgi:hypothetical protein
MAACETIRRATADYAKRQKKSRTGWGAGLKIPSLRWIREGQTLPAGDAEAMTADYGDQDAASVVRIGELRNRLWRLL